MNNSIIKLVFLFVILFFLAAPESLGDDANEEKGDRTSYGLLGGLSYAYSNSNISQSELINYAIYQGIDYPIRLNDNKMIYYGLSVGGSFQYRLDPENNSITANIYYSRLSGYYTFGIL